MSLFLSGLAAAGMRFAAGWSGVWVADVDLLPSSSSDAVPTGIVTITTTQGLAMSGMVDDERTHAFADRRRVRVLGGRGGWAKTVRAQHYHSDIGVRLQEVATTTAAEVGETAVVLTPTTLGLDFVRHNGAASQIFADAGVDWWVGLDGATRIGARPASPAPADLHVLEWNPSASTMRVTSDTIIEPGAIIADQRFGTKTVRQVEIELRDYSFNGTVWVSDSAPAAGVVSELHAALSDIAEDATRAVYSRFHEYIVDAMSGDRAECVAVSKKVPNLVPVSIWAGASGYKASLRPGSRVLVGFRGGEPSKPFLAFYEAPENEGWRPAQLELDALAKLVLGEQAASVVIGTEAAALPIARAPAVDAFAQALATAINAAATAASATTIAPVTGATLGATLAGIGSAVAAAASTMSTTLPSSKVKAS